MMASPLDPHFRNPTEFLPTALALSAPAVWLAAFLLMHRLRAERLFGLALPIALTLAVGTIVLRVARGLPHREGRADARCGVCGEARPNAPVRYLWVTGVLVVMFVKEFPVFCCRRCSIRAFGRTTLHTALFGFWSLLAVFLAPAALLNNVAFLVSSWLGATERAHAHAVLENYRSYARELVATTDRQTAIATLQRNTGLPAERVARFIREL